MIYSTSARYGDCIDVGAVLAQGTPEEVRQDTIKHMEQLGAGGGYVVSSSHDLSADIPVENFYALRDAVHEFRFVSV